MNANEQTPHKIQNDTDITHLYITVRPIINKNCIPYT